MSFLSSNQTPDTSLDGDVPAPLICSTTPGRVQVDGDLLRELRRDRLLSQQDLADECWRRNIRVSIATIKRAEAGRAVRFRIVRELARCFDLPPVRMLRS
ncbi:MAG: helix-turn-helix domain-containing protein [Pseudomonadota bacterium]|nr:helix-turn-helix domain-containing protein [Pseudomonadota bacterium]